ncbi:peptide synthetase [Moritella sp. 24]|uniref:peptide synthetase n=1 Tax=Moritella sp. 24 TaxID=2746230 RepID=UPI001BA7A5F8|nr:peptide synthetase [Moritella sp. 24]QUM76954.1 peptide synthetase [Moritella sp. 24]
MTFKRKLSPTERFYISCDDFNAEETATCVVNQMVLEGRGDIDISAWQQAVVKASTALQGSRLKLSGKLGFSHWTDAGETTELKVIRGLNWDGMSDEGALFLNRPLDVKTSTGCEVLLVLGETHGKHHIIFRTHHAVMDGRGTKTFADEVLRALRKQPLQGDNSFVRDVDLAKSVTSVPGEKIKDTVAAPTGVPVGHDFGSSWQRRTLPGSYKQVLANAGISIAKLANLYSDSDVRIQLPVDLRMHDADIISTGNLTGGLLMQTSPDTTIADWGQQIKSKIADNEHARMPQFAGIPTLNALNWVPLSWLKKSNDKLASKRQETGQYRTSAIISNLGFLHVDEYSAAGFNCSSVFFIPPYFNTTALFLVLAGNKDAVEVILRIPHQLSSNGRFEHALSQICHGICYGHEQETNHNKYPVKQAS